MASVLEFVIIEQHSFISTTRGCASDTLVIRRRNLKSIAAPSTETMYATLSSVHVTHHLIFAQSEGRCDVY